MNLLVAFLVGVLVGAVGAVLVARNNKSKAVESLGKL